MLQQVSWIEFYSRIKTDYQNVQDWLMDDVTELYLHNLQSHNRDQLWDLYCSIYHTFTKETYVSWEDFSGKTVESSKSTKDEIIKKALAIRGGEK